MASKNKKLAAIIVASVVAAAVPTSYLLAAADGGTTAADAETTTDGAADAAGETAEEEREGTVNEQGEVEQDNAVGKVALADQIRLKDYQLKAESDTYKLYYYEPRLSVIVENKLTGKYIYSSLMDEEDDGLSNSSWNAYMKSGIVCTAIKETKGGYQVDPISTPTQITSTDINNGVEAKVKFTEYGLGLTMRITLENDKLNVSIPDDSIIEENEGVYFQTITPFPFMGYTHKDVQNGYMLVPDGNGALIYLNDKEGRYPSGFLGMVYGKDAGFREGDTSTLLWERYEIVTEAYQVMAPIFGMAHLDDQLAYIGIIESGDKRASIQVEPNGASVNYNRCFANFTMRTIYTQPLNNSNSGTVLTVEADRNHEDLSVSYLLLSGTDANYTGMAIAYRNYLLGNNMIAKQDTAYNSRIDFLGTDREEFLIGTRAVTMTTVDDIQEIFRSLKGKGVSSVLSVYKGWQKGGVYSLPVTKYKADSHIGGTRALTDLIEDAEKDDYHVYLYNDALQINKSVNSSTFDAVKMVNKRTLTVDTHQQVYDEFYYLMPTKSDKDINKLVDSYTKKGVKNMALAGISNTLFSYSSKGKYYSRKYSAEVYDKTLSGISDKTNLLLETPSAYLWKYADAILDMPLSTSDYMYLDEEIPFMSMVLKGIVPMYSEYVNFEANKAEYFLKMVESGVFPSFYLTAEDSSKMIYTNSSDLYSTEYATYEQTVVDYDKQLRELASKVEGACITSHEVLGNGVTKVVYDNGVAVYVNYSKTAATVDGISVGAMSYEVGGSR